MYGVHSHTRVGVRENDDASRAATRELRERIDRDTDALLVIDVQEDFIPPRGALAVRGGDEVVSVCSDVMRAFEHVVFSQDYHPKVRVRRRRVRGAFEARERERRLLDDIAASIGANGVLTRDVVYFLSHLSPRRGT